jgi:outer membrane protein assembly factor BamB
VAGSFAIVTKWEGTSVRALGVVLILGSALPAAERNAGPGAVLWRFQPPQGTGNIPLIATDGQQGLYVALGPMKIGTGGVSSVVYRLNPKEGSLVWSRDLGDCVLFGPPVATGKHLLLATHERLSFGSQTRALALDPATGAIRWERPLPGLRRLPHHTGAEGRTCGVSGGGYVLMVCRRDPTVPEPGLRILESKALCLDGETGAERWAFATSGLSSACSSDGDRVLVADRSRAQREWVCLDAVTGKPLWRQTSSAEAGLAFGRAFFFENTTVAEMNRTDSCRQMRCHDPATGQLQWSYPTESVLGVFQGDFVCRTSGKRNSSRSVPGDGVLLSARDGKKRQALPCLASGYGAWFGAILAKGNLLCFRGSELRCLALPDGDQLWRFMAPKGTIEDVQPLGELLLVGCAPPLDGSKASVHALYLPSPSGER